MNRSRFKLDQNHAPIHEALEKFLRILMCRDIKEEEEIRSLRNFWDKNV